MQCIAIIVLLGVAVSQAYMIKSSPEDWDHFVYAQAWPPGTCAEAKEEHHTCKVPTEVKSWVVHGLWPSLGNTKGPTDCNSSLPFDFSQIAFLHPNLTAQWPNLYSDTPADSFWEHEWDKHGTCCLDLPTVSGEKNYFTAGLTLNKKFDILQMLQDSNIVPGKGQYDYDDFINAVVKATGVKPIVECAAYKLDNGTEYHLISQIEICLTKDFQPESCEFTTNSPVPKFQGKIPSYHNNKYFHMKSGGYDSAVAAPQDQTNCPTTHKFNYPPIQY